MITKFTLSGDPRVWRVSERHQPRGLPRLPTMYINIGTTYIPNGKNINQRMHPRVYIGVYKMKNKKYHALLAIPKSNRDKSVSFNNN